jgi:hypothetical protein
MAALLVWNVVALWPTNRPEAQIPYTTFVALARADNVAKVHIVGAIITGQFVHPFQWSPANTPAPATPTPPAPATPPQAPAPKSPLPRTGTPDAGTYTAFRTNFPASIMASATFGHSASPDSVTCWYIMVCNEP